VITFVASPHFIATVNAKTRGGVALSAACAPVCVLIHDDAPKKQTREEGQKRACDWFRGGKPLPLNRVCVWSCVLAIVFCHEVKSKHEITV
jgi:hypothetical protein